MLLSTLGGFALGVVFMVGLSTYKVNCQKDDRCLWEKNDYIEEDTHLADITKEYHDIPE